MRKGCEEGYILTRVLLGECESLRKRTEGAVQPEEQSKTSKKMPCCVCRMMGRDDLKRHEEAILGTRTQLCFTGNENPLMRAQAETRHIHICILDEILW